MPVSTTAKVTATGTLASPNLAFDSFPKLSEAQVRSLIATGTLDASTVEATGELDWPAAPSLVRARVRARQMSARWRETARLEGADARAELASSGLDAPWSVRDLVLEGRAIVPPLAPVPISLRGAARVDYRVDPAGNLFFLEANTIPGMTETSLLPKAAAAAGVDFDRLVARILRGARLDGGRR